MRASAGHFARGAPASEDLNGEAGDGLPVELRIARTRPLFVMRLDVKGPLVIGMTSNGFRRIGIVPGGSFEGERLSGEVLDGGSDWQVVRGDGSTVLDVRLVLKTGDGILVTTSYRGIHHGPRDAALPLFALLYFATKRRNK